MSGVPVYTHSPISSAKASGITPQTAYAPQSSTGLSETTTTTQATHSYPSAQPGEIAPTPTSTKTSYPHYEPAAPQPGSVPSASTAKATSKPSLPPPPKAGELPRPPEYYAAPQAQPTNPPQPVPYPPQMMLPTPETSNGQPPASTTSTNFDPSFAPSAIRSSPRKVEPTSINSFNSSTGRSNLEHPPGYVQNPYASDMTSDQRFATEQIHRSGGSQNLSHNESMRTNNAGFEDDDSVWATAKKWAKETSDTVGSYVTEMNEKISRNLDNSK